MLTHRKYKTISIARKLRRKQTPAEQYLWKKLRNRKFGHLKFRRQYPFGNYIVDFYCAEHKLIIEIDGGIHAMKWKRDYIREQKLLAAGYRLLRFSNSQIFESLEWVLQQIKRATKIPSPSSEGEGQGEGH